MNNTALAARLSRTEAEDFLFRQAEYIDSGDFDSWIDLFTPDAAYWIPARPTDTDPMMQPSFMFDDMPIMLARCGRLLDPNTPGQQPRTRSSHVIGNVRVSDATSPGEVVVRSRFHVTQFRRDVSRYYSGEYIHRLVETGQGLKIKFQRVDLIDCDGIHEILQVYL